MDLGNEVAHEAVALELALEGFAPQGIDIPLAGDVAHALELLALATVILAVMELHKRRWQY